MSAWIVSEAHIDVLVDALAKREMVFGASRDDMGRILWEENHKSVNYRYDEETPTPPYTFKVPPTCWSEDALLKIIGCYEYQTCEHPEWEQSESRAMMTRLADALHENGARSGTPEYESAPWGVCDCGGDHPDYACSTREA